MPIVSRTRVLLVSLTLLAPLACRSSEQEVRLKSGREALAAGRYDEARQIADEVLKSDSRSAPAQDLRGLSLQGMGQAEAEQAFLEAIKLAPGRAEFHDHLAAFYFQRGRREAAIRQWREGERVDPGYTTGRYNLASALLSANRPEEAVTQLREVIRRQPDFLPARINLGVALVALKRLPEAEVELKEATRRAPNDADAAYNLGAAYTAARKGDDAIRELKRALALKPGLAEAHERIATSHFYEGRLEEARREFDEALKLQPDLAEAHFGLGVLLTEEGKGEEAIREYEQVLATQPTHPGASTNLALLYGRTGHPLERATNRIAAFEMYRRALLRRDYAGAWKLLSPASRKSYIDDPDRFAFAAAKGWEEAKARERLAVPGFYLPFLEPPRVEPVSGLPFDPSRMGAERDKETGEWRVDVLIVHAIPGPDPLR